MWGTNLEFTNMGGLSTEQGILVKGNMRPVCNQSVLGVRGIAVIALVYYNDITL